MPGYRNDTSSNRTTGTRPDRVSCAYERPPRPRRYGAVKVAAATPHRHDRDGYQAAQADIIEAMLRHAAEDREANR